VVQEVVQNGVIRGTKEYNKDQFVGGAIAADSSNVVSRRGPEREGFSTKCVCTQSTRATSKTAGRGDSGGAYVIQPQGEKNTVLRIDALF